MEVDKILKAGKIGAEAKKYAKTIIKKNVPLLEIAEKVESKIVELGGKPGFPTNLSIDKIAAHYTPTYDDKTIAQGLLKVDIGVHVDGWIADTAFSLDLEDNEENKKLIQASKDAVDNAIKNIEQGITTGDIGKIIETTINSYGFSPIINLSGHEIDHFDVHAGLTIPNRDDGSDQKLEEGLYAIEPFATTGGGRVKDGPPSNIYMLVNEKSVRSPIAREVLAYVMEEYLTLPFASRWLVKKFGTKALLGLRQLEENGNIHSFGQLIESTGAKVSQAENTILIHKGKVTVTTVEDYYPK
ncbi:type II methionyl aminopeptidase [Nanoarchaeota archaeon]